MTDPFGVPELPSNTAPAAPATPAPAAPAPAPALPAAPAATSQPAVPAAAPTSRAPQVTHLPQTSRADVSKAIQEKDPSVVDFTGEDFEKKLASMLSRATQITKHDRDLALALFRVHLDRAEELDKLPLSMPVATVIGDNTGATLKALEMAQKSSDRLVKIAELLVNARKADEANAIAAYKARAAAEKGATGWDDPDAKDDGRPA